MPLFVPWAYTPPQLVLMVYTPVQVTFIASFGDIMDCRDMFTTSQAFHGNVSFQITSTPSGTRLMGKGL